MRIDGVGGDQLAGGVDHGDLHPGAQAGVEPEHHTRTGGRGEQQVLEVVAENRDGFGLGLLARLVEQVEHQVQLQLRAPGQTAGVREPGIGGVGRDADAGVQRNASFGVGVAGLGVGAGVEFELQEFLAPAAEQRQQAVRGDLRQRLGVVEIVAVFRARFLLAFGDMRADHADGRQPLAQLADQRGVLAPALDQDRARPFQRGLRVGHAAFGIDEAGGEVLRHAGWIGQQAIG